MKKCKWLFKVYDEVVFSGSLLEVQRFRSSFSALNPLLMPYSKTVYEVYEE